MEHQKSMAEVLLLSAKFRIPGAATSSSGRASVPMNMWGFLCGIVHGHGGAVPWTKPTWKNIIYWQPYIWCVFRCWSRVLFDCVVCLPELQHWFLWQAFIHMGFIFIRDKGFNDIWLARGFQSWQTIYEQHFTAWPHQGKICKIVKPGRGCVVNPGQPRAPVTGASPNHFNANNCYFWIFLEQFPISACCFRNARLGLFRQGMGRCPAILPRKIGVGISRYSWDLQK